MTSMLNKLAGVVKFGKIQYVFLLALLENAFPCVVRGRKEHGPTAILQIILASLSSLENF